MLALSIRQPWAWMILHSGKDIENRTWSTKVRGRILVHAAKGMTRAEWALAMRFAHCNVGLAQTRDDTLGLVGCEFETLERGGFVGSVEIVDCVRQTDSPWFMGSHGFVLRNPQPMPFVPYKGRLGFFDVPYPT
jgi:ASCH domain